MTHRRTFLFFTKARGLNKYNVVKKLAGQGQLFIRMKEEYQFLIDQEDVYDDVLLIGAFDTDTDNS